MSAVAPAYGGQTILTYGELVLYIDTAVMIPAERTETVRHMNTPMTQTET